VLADHFFQPMALLRGALATNGLRTDDLHLIDAGTPDEMLTAFRNGTADYVHLQGPAPHQLDLDGEAEVVASIGAETPQLAFSTLCAAPEWLGTDEAAAFLRAFQAGREHAQQAPASEIAAIVAPFLPGTEIRAIASAVAAYQELGTWTGGIEIDASLHQATIEVFRDHDGLTVEPPLEACAVDLAAL
jgi:ABC-type nitrate/sulfonate/bicarbonate transport system substrate-binding protein